MKSHFSFKNINFWFRFLRWDDLLLFFVVFEPDIFAIWTVVCKKQTIQRCNFGFKVIVNVKYGCCFLFFCLFFNLFLWMKGVIEKNNQKNNRQ